MFLTEFTEHTETGESRADAACKFLRERKNLQAIFSLCVLRDLPAAGGAN